MKYEEPKVTDLGAVMDLTEQSPDKCGGSGDAFLPQQLSKDFGDPHCG